MRLQDVMRIHKTGALQFMEQREGHSALETGCDTLGMSPPKIMHLHCKELALSFSAWRILPRTSCSFFHTTQSNPDGDEPTKGLSISGARSPCRCLVGLDCFSEKACPLKMCATCNSYLYIAQLSVPPPFPLLWVSKFQASITSSSAVGGGNFLWCLKEFPVCCMEIDFGETS
uniref:Uncharacterized protein n=1 Tax=Micrurus spixii TaxID=129469 RepID=A0A2D4MGJ4_9SAUR